MRQAADKLWKERDITGEIGIEPLEDGRWRLDVHSEKTIRESTIDALGGRRVKVRSAVTRM